MVEVLDDLEGLLNGDALVVVVVAEVVEVVEVAVAEVAVEAAVVVVVYFIMLNLKMTRNTLFMHALNSKVIFNQYSINH